MKDFWNERFSQKEFIYGKEPNNFFKEELDKLEPGKLLLIGEGEGRNAVYAAQKGWNVDAFDWSAEGKRKAEKFAEEKKVEINYTIQDLNNFLPKENYYDAAGIVFVHLEEVLREAVHQKINNSLKHSGSVIMEVYEKEQMKYNSGGPKTSALLYSLEEIYEDFQDLDFQIFSKEIIELNESATHKGKAAVIRLSAKK